MSVRMSICWCFVRVTSTNTQQSMSVCLSVGVLFERLAQTNSSHCLSVRPSVCLLVFCMIDYKHTAFSCQFVCWSPGHTFTHILRGCIVSLLEAYCPVSFHCLSLYSLAGPLVVHFVSSKVKAVYFLTHRAP